MASYTKARSFRFRHKVNAKTGQIIRTTRILDEKELSPTTPPQLLSASERESLTAARRRARSNGTSFEVTTHERIKPARLSPEFRKLSAWEQLEQAIFRVATLVEQTKRTKEDKQKWADLQEFGDNALSIH